MLCDFYEQKIYLKAKKTKKTNSISNKKKLIKLIILTKNLYQFIFSPVIIIR